MNPINKRLPTLLPRVLPHLVTPHVIEAAAAYCVGVRGEAVRNMKHIQYLPALDFKVARCLNWSSEGAATEICKSILYSLELELDEIYGTTSASPP